MLAFKITFNHFVAEHRNEGMTASVFGNGVFSQFTLSLFLDLKTYNVNMDLAQTLVWGYQEGCSVALGTCLTSVPEHTCTSGTDGCNHDYIGLGICYFAVQSMIMISFLKIMASGQAILVWQMLTHQLFCP